MGTAMSGLSCSQAFSFGSFDQDPYYIAHDVCPRCSKVAYVNKDPTRIKVVVSDDASTEETIHDRNMAKCSDEKCGWVGTVHNLVQRK